MRKHEGKPVFVPRVVFDFDGVIHSYTSGWKGIDKTPDPPVPGIKAVIDRLRADHWEVVVVSTRCATKLGSLAVKDYLKKYDIEVDAVMAEKPPAMCYVDDRAICFTGRTDGLVEDIQSFKPWCDRKVKL